MKDTPSLLVLYGSQTGTARDAGERVAAGASRRNVRVRVAALGDYPIASLPSEGAVVFVVATAGDGEVPDHMRSSWRFLLRADLPCDALANTAVAVFGLGDSAFVKYNAAARRLAARLTQLGAPQLCLRGLGDAQSARGTAGDLEAWLVAELWPALDARFPSAEGIPDTLPLSTLPLPMRCRFHVTWAAQCAGREQQQASRMLTAPALQLAVTSAEAALPFPWPTEPIADVLDQFQRGSASESGEEVATWGLSYESPLLATAELLRAAGAPRGQWPSMPPPVVATLCATRRLTAPEWTQDVRHIAFSEWRCGRTGAPLHLEWRAGDVAVVHPENPPEAVAAFAARLLLDLDDVMRIHPLPLPDSTEPPWEHVQSAADGDDPRLCVPPAAAGACSEPTRGPSAFPPLVSVRTLLSRYLAIASIPRRSALEQLSFFARDGEQRDKLRELASPEGSSLYQDYCVREERTWGEVLDDFTSCTPPLAVLLELIPRLVPRHFSIASASAATGVSPSTLELCVGAVAYKTRYGRSKYGVASQWLTRLPVGSQVALWVRRGNFRVPPAVGSKPPPSLLLIGPGTGVAPMRAVVQEVAARHAVAGGASVPPTVMLFFGCRHAAQDHLYGGDFVARAAASSAYRGGGKGAVWSGLDVYATAFSRDALDGDALASPPEDAAFVRPYVQGQLQVHAAEVRRLVLDEGAHIFIAGSAQRMPADVCSALRDILGSSDSVKGAKILASLERSGRLVVEAWS